MPNICTRHFTWILKKSLLWPPPWQPKLLFPQTLPPASEGAAPELERGLFWSRPYGQLHVFVCVSFRDREGPWATLILLLLFAQVEQDALQPPPLLHLLLLVFCSCVFWDFSLYLHLSCTQNHQVKRCDIQFSINLFSLDSDFVFRD